MVMAAALTRGQSRAVLAGHCRACTHDTAEAAGFRPPVRAILRRLRPHSCELRQCIIYIDSFVTIGATVSSRQALNDPADALSAPRSSSAVQRSAAMAEASSSLMAFDPNALKARFDNWVKEQPPAVEVAVAALGSGAQGVFIGYLLGSFSAMDPSANPNAAAGSSPQVSAQLQALQKGGPWGQARNLGVFTGVNAGLSLAIKKARGGKEDVWGS